MSPFLAWGDFHALLRFAGSTFPEDKWGTTRSLTPRSSGHISTFGLVFFVLKSLLGIARQYSRKKFAILLLLSLGVMFFLYTTT